MSIRSKKKYEAEVWLYVYDLAEQNKVTFQFGLGAFHSGVVVHGSEYMFGQGGIGSHAPGGAEEGNGQCKFRQKVLLGKTSKTPKDVERVISDLSPYFSGKDYNTVQKNCNHFADEFSKRLIGSKKSVMPSWVNRTANLGNKLGGLFGMGGKKNEKIPDAKDFKSFSGKGQTLSGKITKEDKKGNVKVTKEKKGWWPFGKKKKNEKSVTKNENNVQTDQEKRQEEMRKARLARFGN